MSDDKPKGILRIPAFNSHVVRDPPPVINRQPMRGHDELEPLARQVAANGPLMKKFRATVGCDDLAQMSDVIDEVSNYARIIDPALTFAEGARLALILSKIDDDGSPS